MVDQIAVRPTASPRSTFVTPERASSPGIALAESLGVAFGSLAQTSERITSEREKQEALDARALGINAGREQYTRVLQEYAPMKDSFRSIDQAEEFLRSRLLNEEVLGQFESEHAAKGYTDQAEDEIQRELRQFSGHLTVKKQEERMNNIFGVVVDRIENGLSDGLDAPSVFQGIKTELSKPESYGISPEAFDNVYAMPLADYLMDTGKLGVAKSLLTSPRGNGLPPLVEDKNGKIRNAASAKLQQIEKAQQVDNTLANQWKAIELSQMAEQGQITEEFLKEGIEKGEYSFLKPKQIVDLLEKSNEARVQIENEEAAFTAVQEGRLWEIDDKKQRQTAMERFLTDIDDRIEKGKLPPELKTPVLLKAAEENSEAIPEWERKLKAGFYNVGLSELIEGDIPDVTKDSVELYLTLRASNPAVAYSHVKEARMQRFYNTIERSITYQGMDVDQAVKKAANLLQVTDEEYDSQLRSFNYDELREKAKTALDKKWSWNNGENVGAYEPIIQRLAADYRIGAMSTSDALDAAVEDIKDNVFIIDGYAAPRGEWMTLPELIPEKMDIVRKAYVHESPDAGYEPDDLVLTPSALDKNLWLLVHKHTGTPLRRYTTEQLKGIK